MYGKGYIRKVPSLSTSVVILVHEHSTKFPPLQQNFTSNPMKTTLLLWLSFCAMSSLASSFKPQGHTGYEGDAALDIKAKYLQYIDTINSDMPPGSLDPFLKDGFVFNGFPPSTPADAIENVKSVRQLLPKLHFEITWMILERSIDALDEGQLAVRANITYEPEPGKELAFYEHCFYRFEAGKIAFSQSVVDTFDLPEKDRAIARNL
ncbi:uncharacterized protein AB675_7400 [Cyphellophora attinorum]|uniref:SnoaL-like domain-containing protein n=1 Tax=Cyphellophora attinorum TaxID=1664694 RepID=A0A0N1NVM2_9EURO|nr:uncharacterized protein AB675_7400 [Phialophora attinorum]KPI34530.1 hypothetical protein AB675_7400 [Phialophora attinorum]